MPFTFMHAASLEKTSLSLLVWFFPLITLSPLAGGGLSKQQKHQNVYVLLSCGWEKMEEEEKEEEEEVGGNAERRWK